MKYVKQWPKYKVAPKSTSIFSSVFYAHISASDFQIVEKDFNNLDL